MRSQWDEVVVEPNALGTCETNFAERKGESRPSGSEGVHMPIRSSQTLPTAFPAARTFSPEPFTAEPYGCQAAAFANAELCA